MKRDKNENKVPISELKPGEIIHGKKHKYIILKQLSGQTLIISQDLMLKVQKFDNDSPEYSKSELKEKMDKDILPIFESDFGKENIIENEVDLVTVDMQKDYGTCTCKVRPLTFDEAREYNDLIVNKELDDWWWTLTPWSTEERGWKYSLAVVTPAGNIDHGYYDYGGGVRPFCILKSNIFVSKG